MRNAVEKARVERPELKPVEGEIPSHQEPQDQPAGWFRSSSNTRILIIRFQWKTPTGGFPARHGGTPNAGWFLLGLLGKLPSRNG